MTTQKNTKYAIIGAGPSGLSCAKVFLDLGIPFQGYEASDSVGGLWNFENPNSPLYPNVHLISSRKRTEFKHFPMKGIPEDYPHHKKVFQYLKDYAQHFNLSHFFDLNTRVKQVTRLENGYWKLSTETGKEAIYKGIVIASGIHTYPKYHEIKGEFAGKLIHSAQIKDFHPFTNRKVLVIGAGNSGCDIACDLSRITAQVGLSMRSGNYIIPKYILGKPADRITPGINLPVRMKQFMHEKFLDFISGKPDVFGLPKPDCRIYEKHPIINSELKYQIGHGHIHVYPEVTKFEGHTVHFEDNTSDKFDDIITATGFSVNYPFLDKIHLNWESGCPQLYLNIFNKDRKNLFVMGLVSSLGLGWEGRYQQALIIGKYIKARAISHPTASNFEAQMHSSPDLHGGYDYKMGPDTQYYVHNQTYLKHLKKGIKSLSYE